MKTKFKILIPALLIAFAGCEKAPSINEEGNLVPKTVEFDASLPAVAVNGTLLHAEAFGNPQDPMVVVLHGGPGSDYRSLLNCKKFAENGYYVVFYDQRGSGLSKRESKDSYSLHTMLDDLTGVIAHYRSSSTQKVFLLGHSWGGILATSYINEYPAAITGAILAEPGGFKWDDIKDYVGRLNSYSFFSETFNDVTYLDQFLTGNEDQQAILDYKLGLAQATDGAPDSPLGNEATPPFWRSGAIVNRSLFDLGKKEEPDWTTHLNEYNTGVLFVYSERNTAYGLSHAQHVSSAYPNVHLEMIRNAGHDMLSFDEGFNNFFPFALSYLNNH